MEQFIAFLKGWRLKIFLREAKVPEMLKGRRIAGRFMLCIYFCQRLLIHALDTTYLSQWLQGLFTHTPPATQAQRQFLLEVFKETQKNDESY